MCAGGGFSIFDVPSRDTIKIGDIEIAVIKLPTPEEKPQIIAMI